MSSSAVVAQSERARLKTARLPRVGVIKDYEATGMATGCGNLYFTFPKRAEPADEQFVYLARSDGSDGWLNLDGRDTRLRLLKSATVRSGGAVTRWRYYYLAGRATLVTVTITRNEAVTDDVNLAAVIAIRRGRAVRRIRAVGSSDC